MESEMGARIKAEQAAKAKSAQERIEAKKSATTDAATQKAEAVKKVQQQILEERKASTPGVSPGVSLAMSGMPGMGQVAAKGAGIMAEYTVKKGDTLGAIAKNFYGVTGPKYWNLIQQANKDLIKDVNLIYPGQVFKIPVLPEELKKK